MLGIGVTQVVHSAQAARCQLLRELGGIAQQATKGLLHLPQPGDQSRVPPCEAGQAGQAHAACAAHLRNSSESDPMRGGERGGVWCAGRV